MGDMREKIAEIIEKKTTAHAQFVGAGETWVEGEDDAADAIIASLPDMVNPKEGELERIVWSAMAWARKSPGPEEVPEYTDTGNSFAEIECRATVRRIMAALGVTQGEGNG